MHNNNNTNMFCTAMPQQTIDYIIIHYRKYNSLLYISVCSYTLSCKHNISLLTLLDVLLANCRMQTTITLGSRPGARIDPDPQNFFRVEF